MNDDIKNRLIFANKAYRLGTPIMSDLEFDDLLEQYSKTVSQEDFEKFAGTLHENSGKAKLPFIMGSLIKLKCSEPDSIIKFISKYAKNGLSVSAKVDGISSCLVYENGKLAHAMTRGDGYNGELLDDKIKYVKGVLQELPEKLNVAIRGELVILKDDFKNMNGSNPRNVCAGIMNRKTNSKEWNTEDIKAVTFIPYTILGSAYTKDEQFSMLDRLGFMTAWHKTIPAGHLNFTDNHIVDELFKYATQELPYEIDGCVISSPSYKNEDKYRPDAQTAVKTNTMSAETTLIDISWDGPSKNGRFCPCAIVEPVSLGGSVISRCTLNNIEYIEKLGLKFGDRVRICKSGDIIPQIVEVIRK